jgi:hypothetical protein
MPRHSVSLAERILGELGEGGVVQMLIGETFWARRFGMLIDKFRHPMNGQLREADLTASPFGRCSPAVRR